MSSITSLFQSLGWRFVEELASPLLKSPEWNFAQEVAANPLNRNIKLASVSRAVTGSGKPAFDPAQVFANANFTYDFVRKLPTPSQMLDAGGQILEVYYTKAPLPTPFHLINNRLVASVKIISSEFKEKVRAILHRERYQITDNVVQLDQNKNFNAQIGSDISNWNASMQLKLMTIFLSCIAFGAMISIVVIKVTFVALAALAAVRLLQLYSLQKKNTQIIHVGHWVVQLWEAFSLNPMLRHQYGQYYDGIFFSERRILEYKPAAKVKTSDQKKTTPGIAEYPKFCEEFSQLTIPFIRKCKTAGEQHQWVTDFFTKDLFKADFLKEHPAVMSGPFGEKWKKVAVFQVHHKKLKQLYDNLALNWSRIQPKIQQHHDEAKKKCEERRSQVEKSAKTTAETLDLNEEVARQYQSLILQAFEEKYSAEISDRGSVTKERMGALAYSQADDFFNKAYYILVLNQPYILIPVSLQKMMTDFQAKLDKISQKYPQNVIKKAKALSSEPGYHEFIEHVFKPK